MLDNIVSIHTITRRSGLPWVLGFLVGLKVFGLLKCTLVRTFLTRVPWVPFTIFFWTFWAFVVTLAGAFFSSATGAFSAVFLGTGFLPLASALAGSVFLGDMVDEKGGKAPC